MEEKETLSLTGAAGRPITLRRWASARSTGRLAVLWPGLRYSCDQPLLYYAAQALLAQGVDVAQVWVDYRDEAFRQAAPEVRWRWLLQDGRTVMQALQQAEQPSAWVWVGKSLGTLTMAALWSEGTARPVAASLWLTPLLTFPVLVKALRHLEHPALVVASRQDPTFDAGAWAQVERAAQVRPLLLDQGNHSLEVPGDLEVGLNNLRRVTLAFAELLAETLPAA